MFIRPEIYALSERNPWQDPANPGAVPPDIGNPMATEAECKHHCNLWKILKNSMIPTSTLVVLAVQHLTKLLQINFKQCNKLEIVVWETTLPKKLVDELFHTYDHATDTKIDDTIKTLWDPTKLIEMLFKQIEDA